MGTALPVAAQLSDTLIQLESGESAVAGDLASAASSLGAAAIALAGQGGVTSSEMPVSALMDLGTALQTSGQGAVPGDFRRKLLHAARLLAQLEGGKAVGADHLQRTARLLRPTASDVLMASGGQGLAAAAAAVARTDSGTFAQHAVELEPAERVVKKMHTGAMVTMAGGKEDAPKSRLSAKSLAAFRLAVKYAKGDRAFMRSGWKRREEIGEISRAIFGRPDRIMRREAGRAYRFLVEVQGLLPADLSRQIEILREELIGIGVANATGQPPQMYPIDRSPFSSLFRWMGNWFADAPPEGELPVIPFTHEFGSPELRRKPMVTAEGHVIPYPFSDQPVEWRVFYEPHTYRLAVLRHIDKGGRFLPETLEQSLDGRGGGGKVFPAPGGRVVKFYNRAVDAERLIVIQQLLDAVGIPHMPMESGHLALSLAREGVVVQRCMPEGAKMLCGFTYGQEDMYTAVDRVLGRGAREGLVVLVSKLDAVRNDTQLRDQSAVRGFSVSTQRGFTALLDQEIEQSTPIDVHGGDSFANVAWHPSIGWFLFDW